MPAASRRLAVVLPAALALAVAACGGAGEAEVGKCTNADPDLTVQVVEIEIVDCDSDEATEKIVREVQDGSECEAASLTSGEQVFCTEPL
jgi:hypothetical protein